MKAVRGSLWPHPGPGNRPVSPQHSCWWRGTHPPQFGAQAPLSSCLMAPGTDGTENSVARPQQRLRHELVPPFSNCWGKANVSSFVMHRKRPIRIYSKLSTVILAGSGQGAKRGSPTAILHASTLAVGAFLPQLTPS